MRAAIIDLGTNTFHLLIADIVECSAPVLVYQETVPVKLGEGGISAGYISRAAVERGTQALKNFKARITQYQPDEIRSAATSAIRTSSNGKDFIERISREIGLDLNIIQGDEEARLIYQGVRAAVNLSPCSLIMDIGGGSVEFILCDDKRIFWKKSFLLGAARLMDSFHHSDPINEIEINEIRNHLSVTLAELEPQLDKYLPAQLVGSAGVFETFAAIQEPDFRLSFEQPEFIFDVRKLKAVLAVILKSSHEERIQMEAIIPLRKDMIVVSSILTDYVLKLSGLGCVKLSAYSLKEGILFGMIPGSEGLAGEGA